ncbi:YHYH domain-containing protein [Sporomusa aerivorans]|uniref:YHYH domain-containing protein n=1 Tax=Sporomusa aerivorans TaxID=204936 RepID=UPI003529EF6D
MTLKTTSKFFEKALVTLLVVTLPVSFANAHPGRTDSNGGHYVRTAGWGYPVGSYHYHNGGPSKPAKKKPADVVDIKLVQQKLNELGYD